MRLETFPLILGALVGLVGLLLILDALTADSAVREERRRRPRRARDRFGEVLVGLGAVAMAAAFVGRDTWRYSTVAVIVGSFMLLWGAMRNGAYIRGLVRRHERPKTQFVEGPRRIR